MRVDRASRLIAAPRERVFAAFTDAGAITRWLPPAGARAVLHAFDPVDGGAFRMTLIFAPEEQPKGKTAPDSDLVDGRFVAVRPPDRIEQAFSFVSADPRFAGTMRMTWRMCEDPGGTLVSVAARDVPAGIAPEDHRKGMESSLENLANFLAENPRDPAG